jgi:FAD/FMN-containing dehydrogenase
VTGPDAGRTAPLPDGHPFYVLVQAEGGDIDGDQSRFESVLGEAMVGGLAVDVAVATSGREREALWALRDDVERVHGQAPSITFDVSLRVSDIEGYLDQVQAILAAEFPDNRTWIFGHLGDGNLHIVVAPGAELTAVRPRVEQAVYGPLAAINGSISGEHGIGLEKKPWLSLSRSPEEIATLGRLKAALDPNGILNPGKVL